MRFATTLLAATGMALLAGLTGLTAGCDDETASRRSDLSDAPSSRFSTFRGPYGPYYIRPAQPRSVQTAPPDPALDMPAPDLDSDPFRNERDALTRERGVANPPNDTPTPTEGPDLAPRKFHPPTHSRATPYSMATPTPFRPLLRPLGPPSSTSAHPDTAEERWIDEERKRRTVLFPHPDSTVTEPSTTSLPPAASPPPPVAPDTSTP